MIKKAKASKDNVLKFPSKLSDLDKEIEAIIFAAAEPPEQKGDASPPLSRGRRFDAAGTRSGGMTAGCGFSQGPDPPVLGPS